MNNFKDKSIKEMRDKILKDLETYNLSEYDLKDIWKKMDKKQEELEETTIVIKCPFCNCENCKDISDFVVSKHNPNKVSKK